MYKKRLEHPTSKFLGVRELDTQGKTSKKFTWYDTK